MTLTDTEEQSLQTAVGSHGEKRSLHPQVPVNGVLPCHTVSLLSDGRSYFESGILEAGCCRVSSVPRPGSLPGTNPGPAPTSSASAWTCSLGWASGRGGAILGLSIQLDSGQALPCAPGLDN